MLSLPRPLCAGATSDYVEVMPARSRKSLAKLAEHAAKKESKLGSDASPASAGGGVERASIEHGAPPRPFDLARRN